MSGSRIQRAQASRTQADGRSPLAYVLDDQPNTVTEIRANLQTLGFDVCTQSGFDQIRKDLSDFANVPELRPDLFVVDVSWSVPERATSILFDDPELANTTGPAVGLAIVQTVVANDALRTVPIIVYSAAYEAEPELIAALREKGARLVYVPREILKSRRQRGKIKDALTEIGVGADNNAGTIRVASYRALANVIEAELGVRARSLDRLVGLSIPRETQVGGVALSRFRQLYSAICVLRRLYLQETLPVRARERSRFVGGLSLAGAIESGDWQGVEAICDSIDADFGA